MLSLRALIGSNRLAVCLLLALALAMKALVPAGFMVSTASRTLTIETNRGGRQGPRRRHR